MSIHHADEQKTVFTTLKISLMWPHLKGVVTLKFTFHWLSFLNSRQEEQEWIQSAVICFVFFMQVLYSCERMCSSIITLLNHFSTGAVWYSDHWKMTKLCFWGFEVIIKSLLCICVMFCGWVSNSFDIHLICLLCLWRCVCGVLSRNEGAI